MKLQGRVEKADLGPGVLLLVTDDGKRFHLAGNDRGWKRPGSRMALDGELDAGGMSSSGFPVFRVSAFQEI